jgi:hypothetical protein
VKLLEVFGDTMLQVPGGNVSKVAGREGEQDASNQLIRSEKPFNLWAAREGKDVAPLSPEVLCEIDTGGAKLSAWPGEWRNRHGAQV